MLFLIQFLILQDLETFLKKLVGDHGVYVCRASVKGTGGVSCPGNPSGEKRSGPGFGDCTKLMGGREKMKINVKLNIRGTFPYSFQYEVNS
jgi:hypothetical protein